MCRSSTQCTAFGFAPEGDVLGFWTQQSLTVGTIMALAAVTAGKATAQETFHGNAARTGVYASSGPERLKGVAAEGDSTLVAFDYLAQKSVPLPPAIRSQIEQLEGKNPPRCTSP